MKKIGTIALLFVVAFALIGFTQSGVSVANASQVNIDELGDDEILATLDNERFSGYFDFTREGPPSSSFTVDITAQRITGQIQGTVEIKFKIIEGQFFGRIDFLSPETEAGKIWIVGPEGTFFKGPDSDGFIPVPGTVFVFGDATVAETVGVFFNGGYDIVSKDATTLEDGSNGYVIEVEAKKDENGDLLPFVTFPFATVTTDENLRPIYIELFGANRSKFHFNTFEEYAEIDGRPYFKRQLLDNLITVENQTLLDTSNLNFNVHPDSIFDPDDPEAANPQ